MKKSKKSITEKSKKQKKLEVFNESHKYYYYDYADAPEERCIGITDLDEVANFAARYAEIERAIRYELAIKKLDAWIKRNCE